MLGCVRAWLVDSIVRVADSLSFSLSLFLLLFFSFLLSWVCRVWMVARWVVAVGVRPFLCTVQRRMLYVCIDGLHRGILCEHYLSRLRTGTAGTFRGQVEGDEV